MWIAPTGHPIEGEFVKRRTSPRGECDDHSMPPDKHKWTVGPNVVSEPTFDVVLRGYHRREVDAYARLVEGQLTGLITEQQDAQAQIRILTDQVERLRAAANELRPLPKDDDSLRFRHLGIRVEHILRLAEDQADALTAQSTAEANAMCTEAQRLLDEARDRAARATRDFEIALAERRGEAEREIAEHRRVVAEEATRVAAQSNRMRTDAEAALRTAQEEAHRVTKAATAEAELAHSTAARETQALWAKTREQIAALTVGAKAYAQATRTTADKEFREIRRAAQRHAEAVRAAATKSAAEVLAQAEQLATEARTGREPHAPRVHAAGQVRHVGTAKVSLPAPVAAAGAAEAESQTTVTTADSPTTPEATVAAAGATPTTAQTAVGAAPAVAQDDRATDGDRDDRDTSRKAPIQERPAT